MIRKTLLVGALLAALPASAFASGFNWNATLASGYYFRGVDQNSDQPALQLGAGYDFGNGFYAGVWGSNVDFGDSTNIEIDTFVGWAGELGDQTSLDVQLVRYNYLNEPDGVDYAYNELISKLSVAEHYTFTLGYTNNYFNMDLDSLYYGVGGSWEVGNGFSFDASVGYTTVSDIFENFVDYRVGVSRAVGPATVSLGYIGTDDSATTNFGPDNTDDKFVLTVGFGG